MSKPINARKHPSNSIRLLLIPVLAMVLLAVVCWPTAKQANLASLQLPLNSVEMAPQLGENTANRPVWPVVHLDDVISCNPFQPLLMNSAEASIAMHDDAGTEEIENTDSKAASVPSTPGTVQAIYFDARGAAAILDSRVVRIGDILANGSRIVSIHAQGVSLGSVE